MADNILDPPEPDDAALAPPPDGAPTADEVGAAPPPAKQNWLKNLKKAPWYVWVGLAIAGGTLVVAFVTYQRNKANGSAGSTVATNTPGGVTYGYGTHYDASNGGGYDTMSHSYYNSGLYDSQPPQMDYNALIMALFQQAFNRGGGTTDGGSGSGSGSGFTPSTQGGPGAITGGNSGGGSGYVPPQGGGGGFIPPPVRGGTAGYGGSGTLLGNNWSGGTIITGGSGYNITPKRPGGPRQVRGS